MKKYSFLQFILILSILTSNAQVNTYNFVRTGASFPFLAASGAVVTEYAVSDDMVLPGIVSIPFNFTFAGVHYTSLGIAENGFIWFGSAQPYEVAFSSPISSTLNTNIQGIVSAYGIDLHPIATSLATTKISSAVLGTAPNRIIVIEWRETARIETINHAAGPDILDFQIRLSETTNAVEVTYGRAIMNPNFTSDTEVGIRTTDTDFNNRTTNNANWDVSLPGAFITDTCTLSSTSKPAYGQRFIWTPNSLSLDDLNKNDVVIYPNPALNILNIEGLDQDNYNYVIYDMAGRIVMQNSINGKSIEVDSLNQGNYILNITDGTRKIIKKFCKL